MANILSAYVEQEIMSADPLRLVCMLYQAAIMEVREARRHLASGNILARAGAISKASNIIGELASSLDHQAGGEIAERLAALYAYLLHLLLDANQKKADALLAEALGLLTTLAEGWQEIATVKRAHSDDVPMRPNTFLPAQIAEPIPQSWSF